MSTERLQKVLSAAGVASRRAAEELIAQGRVTVDGRVAQLGDRVDPRRAEVRVDGRRVNVDPERVYVMLNKPRGVVSTLRDPQGRPTVADLVNLPQRLHPVGRLDRDTEGLLLLTNDGELTHRLLHPSSQVPRVYLALVRGQVRKPVLAQLRQGVELSDGLAKPRRVAIVDRGAGRTLLELELTEGRNREVRRLLGAVGLYLERLARVAFDGLTLSDLRQGKWRFLTPQEVSTLWEAVERTRGRSAGGRLEGGAARGRSARRR